jgi:small subunit ribosomal protein S6
MRRYEMMVLMTDRLDEEAAVAAFDRRRGSWPTRGGTCSRRPGGASVKLAYEIDNRDHGFYGVLDFEATSEAVNELERQLKISDDVIRFKTVRPEIRVHARS